MLYVTCNIFLLIPNDRNVLFINLSNGRGNLPHGRCVNYELVAKLTDREHKTPTFNYYSTKTTYSRTALECLRLGVIVNDIFICTVTRGTLDCKSWWCAR